MGRGSGFGRLAACLLVIAALAACGAPGPVLRFDASVDASFVALADAAWAQFLAAFPARRDCFGPVTLAASYSLAERAVYEPATATVTVKTPGAPALLEAALIHEWAHHLEHQCADHQQLRPTFLAAQGLPPDTTWATTTTADTAAWAATPSEQYAEAAVELVLGRRAIPTAAHVSPAAVRALADWAAGR